MGVLLGLGYGLGYELGYGFRYGLGYGFGYGLGYGLRHGLGDKCRGVVKVVHPYLLALVDKIKIKVMRHSITAKSIMKL